MRVTCPACGAQYAPPEGSIPPEGRAVRCSSCKAEWRVEGAPAEPPVAAPPAAGAVVAAHPAPVGVETPVPSAPVSQVAPVCRAVSEPAVAPPSQPPRRAAVGDMTASLETEPSGGGSGFMAGFATVTLLALAAIAVYANHQAVADAIPALAGPLQTFVSAMDAARDWLARALNR